MARTHLRRSLVVNSRVLAAPPTAGRRGAVSARTNLSLILALFVSDTS